ncbi:MAG: hypothetical protein U9Q82_03440 [Chloroflexota bacterium]|nr:hypothetical protein [Chloroflexota bacterium]
MRKAIVTILFVAGIALIVAAVSVKIFPQWVSLPGGVALLILAAFLGVAKQGGNLKDWRDFFFEDKDKAPETESTPTTSPSPPPAVDISGNWMIGSNKLQIWGNNIRFAMNKLLGRQVVEIKAQAGADEQEDRKSDQ